jgi:hypothetical protein
MRSHEKGAPIWVIENKGANRTLEIVANVIKNLDNPLISVGSENEDLLQVEYLL